jgi:DHA1 family tetracycline resistance protein-like MFS transporter
MSEAPPRQRSAKKALAFIFITVLLDMMALGMVAPVLPSLVAALLQGHPLPARLVAHLPRGTVSLAAVIFGLFNAVFALMQFFFSPVIGSLSDRFGRRPLILASNIGLGLNYALMAWAPNLAWLFLGRALSGITGASFGTASAYIADSTPPEKRAGAFGILGAAFGAGFILGPSIGGPLGDIDPRLPFIVAAVFSLSNALYGLFVLPESLPPALRTGFSWKRANPIGALVLLRRHPELFGLAGVAFLSNLAQVSLPSIVVLYAHYRYGWTTGAAGLTLGLVGVAVVVVQVGVVGRFVKRFGNRTALVLGLIFGTAGLAVAGLAANSAIFWMGIPVLALWGIAGAANQTIMSHHVSSSEQGQLQGANASLTSISELIGPLIFPLIFAYFVTPGHTKAAAGAPFILGCVLLAIAAAWAWWATRGEERDTSPPSESLGHDTFEAGLGVPIATPSAGDAQGRCPRGGA